MSQKDLAARIEGLERITRLFRYERVAYISITCVALFMLLANAALLIYEKKAGPIELSLLFGSTGLVSYSLSRLIYMWNVAMQILVPVVHDQEGKDHGK